MVPGIKVLSPRNAIAYMRDKLRESADYCDNDSVPEGSSGDEEERCQHYGWALQKKVPSDCSMSEGTSLFRRLYISGSTGRSNC